MVAVLAAFVQAMLAAEAATDGASTPRWVYLGLYGAALTMSFSANIATSSV